MAKYRGLERKIAWVTNFDFYHNLDNRDLATVVLYRSREEVFESGKASDGEGPVYPMRVYIYDATEVDEAD